VLVVNNVLGDPVAMAQDGGFVRQAYVGWSAAYCESLLLRERIDGAKGA
jgi:hypothetical protein